MQPAPLKTFIIYARADAQFKDELLIHLRPFVRKGLLEKWVDSDLLPGEEWEKRIEKELDAAHLVIMLVSADALYSDFIEKKELKIALEKKQAGAARVVPILIRDCLWEHSSLSTLQLLPKDENGMIRGVAAWTSHDSAWTYCLRELKKLVDEIQAALQKEIETAEAAKKAEELKKQQIAEAEKTERSRHRLDEAIWKKTSESLPTTPDAQEKINLLKDYLQDAAHRNHRLEAEEQIEELRAELAAEQKIKEAQERREAEHRRKEQEAARLAEQARLEEIEREKHEKAEAERKKKAAEQAEQERKEQEAARLAELRKQKETEKGLPEMVLVRGGTFQMGSNDYDREKPIHSVTLPDFEIGKYPVTQKFWQEIMGNNPSLFQGCDDCPVEQTFWDDVQEFLKKLNQKYPGKNYRLPSEAEWEYAACGGSRNKGFTYAGSNDIDEVAWYDKNSSGKTHPVGSKKANELGIYDMSGNVLEWCQDVWHGNYQGAPGDGSAWDGGSKGDLRVLRGGSWLSDPDFCRAAARYWNSPTLRYNTIFGFRLARH